MTQDEQKSRGRPRSDQARRRRLHRRGQRLDGQLFIDELAKIKHRIKGAVASSIKTAERLKGHGIPH
jgi:ribose 5-phosphate isomerase A